MRAPVFFLPHGGGPCFFMEWTPPDTWTALGEWLRGLSASILRPAAILVVSGHWEQPNFTVQTNPQPPLLFDYYGFPAHTYKLTYPAPGSTWLSERVVELLRAKTDPSRGFDHGVFVPFKLVFPQADIPVVQLALKAGLDPAEHIAAGKALAPLRDRNVLIVGSGMSFHNLRAFGPSAKLPSEAFDTWLTETVVSKDRNARLVEWEKAPSARFAHPQEEHLIPLMVAAGAAGDDPGRQVFTGSIMGARISAYRFGV